jgi:hypothetical protein
MSSAMKKQRLRQLAERIIRKLGGRQFLYPAEPENGVAGFSGEGPLIVIGIDPSESKWLKFDESRRLLYDTLIRNGAGTCHLTDCFKERNFRKTPAEKRITARGWNVDILHEEIDIVEPDGFVAIGPDAEKFLYEIDIARDYSLYGVVHFAAFRYAADREAAKQQFRREFAGAIHSYRRYAISGEIEGLSDFLSGLGQRRVAHPGTI